MDEKSEALVEGREEDVSDMAAYWNLYTAENITVGSEGESCACDEVEMSAYRSISCTTVYRLGSI